MNPKITAATEIAATIGTSRIASLPIKPPRIPLRKLVGSTVSAARLILLPGSAASCCGGGADWTCCSVGRLLHVARLGCCWTKPDMQKTTQATTSPLIPQEGLIALLEKVVKRWVGVGICRYGPRRICRSTVLFGESNHGTSLPHILLEQHARR